MCFINCTLRESSVLQPAGHLLHIIRAHARQLQKSFCFKFYLQWLDEYILPYSLLHAAYN